MKTGSPPTPLKARTGEFTPPGKRPLARASSRRDFSVFRDDMAGRDLAPLPATVKHHSVTESLSPSCLRRADAAGAQVGLRLRTCKKPRAAGSARDATPHSVDQCGARCALCRLSEPRADSRRGAW